LVLPCRGYGGLLHPLPNTRGAGALPCRGYGGLPHIPILGGAGVLPCQGYGDLPNFSFFPHTGGAGPSPAGGLGSPQLLSNFLTPPLPARGVRSSPTQGSGDTLQFLI